MNSPPSFKEADYRSVYSLESGYISVLTQCLVRMLLLCAWPSFFMTMTFFFLFFFLQKSEITVPPILHHDPC